jgi:SAM-dependent methyltransferase
MDATPWTIPLSSDQPAPPVDQRRVACPICGGRRLHFALEFQECRVEECADCGFRLLNPQPDDETLTAIYSSTYFLGHESADTAVRTAAMKQATARAYLEDIARYRGAYGGRLLEIGCGLGDFLSEAERHGYELTGVELSPSAVRTARARVPGAVVHCGILEDVALPPASFDVCVLCDVIEHVRDPMSFVRTIRSLLKHDGVLYIATPSLDSWSARMLGSNWMEYKPEHLSYFNRNSAQSLLYRAGFQAVLVRPNRKVLTLDYVADHFRRFPVPLVTPLVSLLGRITPRRLRQHPISLVASGMAICARAAEPCRREKLSVIVPAYNEATTFDALMQGLLGKALPGMDIEIVLVESNSTDGTRQLAERYRHHPRMNLVLEDRPRGKGHAVRAGLSHAAGDYVLIQDADLEYDLNDYEALLEPLRQGHTSFVLGARHGGSALKMRRFERQKLLSLLLNCGHWFFTMLINVLFLVWLRDPFTMFKVFRRDCLAGLRFRCNRFDFDYELLISLIRKGYRPLEIPVNYRSRSFQQGKKVAMFRDPLTWLWALVRLRLMRVDPLREIARQRADAPAELPVALRRAA